MKIELFEIHEFLYIRDSWIDKIMSVREFLSSLYVWMSVSVAVGVGVHFIRNLYVPFTEKVA